MPNTDQEPMWLTRFLSDKEHRGRLVEQLSERERFRAQCRGIPSAPPTPSPSNKSNQDLLLHYSTSKASSSENATDNRYFDVLPYDRTCVFVNVRPTDANGLSGNAAYLNASWVKENNSGIWWIAAQAPLPHTIPIFLAQCTPLVPPAQRPRVIVQLTANFEAGRRKAHEYLPGTVGERGRMLYPLPLMTSRKELVEKSENVLEVVLAKRRDVPEAGAVQSIVHLTLCTIHRQADGSQNEERGATTRVVHFYYAAWPDFGVPTEPVTILNLAKVVDATNTNPQGEETRNTPGVKMGSTRRPILVHCSAGVGRTGTFVALTSILRQFGIFGQHLRPEPVPLEEEEISPLGTLPSEFEGDMIMTEIDRLREYRCMMVQRWEQITFVYNVLRRALSGGA